MDSASKDRLFFYHFTRKDLYDESWFIHTVEIHQHDFIPSAEKEAKTCMTVAVGGDNQGSLESTKKRNRRLKSTAEIRNSGVCCWGQICPTVEKQCDMNPAGAAGEKKWHLKTKNLILRTKRRSRAALIQKSRITREQKMKNEMRSSVSSSIVQTVGSQWEPQPIWDWLYSHVYTLDRFDYMRLSLCSLFNPYRGNQQGVHSHFICCEPLESLRYDL